MTLPTLRRGGSINTLRRPENQSNGISRLDPWNDFTSMDRVFDSFFRNPMLLADRMQSRAANSDPQIELYENSEELIAYIFAPGMDATNLDITATTDQLTVRADRKPRFTVEDNSICHTPWINHAASSSTLSASFTLPAEINPDKVNASYKDGIIEVHMAKNEAVKPKQVKVSVSGQ